MSQALSELRYGALVYDGEGRLLGRVSEMDVTMSVNAPLSATMRLESPMGQPHFAAGGIAGIVSNAGSEDVKTLERRLKVARKATKRARRAKKREKQKRQRVEADRRIALATYREIAQGSSVEATDRITAADRLCSGA